MDQYILNLLPRIIEAGKKLNQIEAIVDKVWVKYGEEDYETYRFRRNNLALVSLAGVVEERKWEILPPNGLYISKDGRGLMYRQAVVFESLMLVQLESIKYQPVIFYDEAKIPDGDVVRYLNMVFAKQKINDPIKPTLNSETIILNFDTSVGTIVIKQRPNECDIINAEAYLNDIVAADGTYYTTIDEQYKWIKIKKGKVNDFQMY